MDVVNTIASVRVDENSKPLEDVVIDTITVREASAEDVSALNQRAGNTPTMASSAIVETLFFLHVSFFRLNCMISAQALRDLDPADLFNAPQQIPTEPSRLKK
ncbi:MAG: hypothetical protein V8T10_00980, partial [Merdibacter sp.]